MDVQLSVVPPDTLIVHLAEGHAVAEVPVRPSRAGVLSLTRALGEATRDGYGECFWPGTPEGQYWWIFKRDHETLETIAMWTRGGATGWEHVFRATDSVAWVVERVAASVAKLGLTVDP